MQVTRYERQDSETLIAHVDFFIEKWKMHLRDVRLIRSKNGGMFLSFPSKYYEGREKPWVPYLEFEGEANKRFQKTAMDAIQEYVNRQGAKSENDHRYTTQDAGNNGIPF